MIPSIPNLPQNRKRYGTLAQGFLTTLSFLAASTLTPISIVTNARGRLPSVSLAMYPRGLPRFTWELLAFLNTGKTGFAQAEFNVTCGNCQSSVTRERLGVAKFTRDAVLDPDDPNHVDIYGKSVYLP